MAKVTIDTERVWEQLHTNIRRFVGGRVRNAADVDDVVQRVFLRVHEALPTLRDDDRLHAWVYQTTRNAIADYYRVPAQRRELSAGGFEDLAGDSDPAVNEDSADERSALSELAGCLKPLFEELPFPDQEALRLVEFDGVTQVDAARHLGLSVSGMKSRVQRARQRLKAIFEDCCRIDVDRRGGIMSYEPRREAPCERCECTDENA
jgi:RNA polymerase sigma-70 factor, ECF subfamily